MPTKSTRPPRESFAVAATPAYRDWLGRFAATRGCDVSRLVAASLEAFALGQGYSAPPPRINVQPRARTFGVRRNQVVRAN